MTTITLSKQLCSLIQNNNLSEIKNLINSNPNLVNLKCRTYNEGIITPLLLSIYKKHKDIAAYLIENGADVSCITYDQDQEQDQEREQEQEYD